MGLGDAGRGRGDLGAKRGREKTLVEIVVEIVRCVCQRSVGCHRRLCRVQSEHPLDPREFLEAISTGVTHGQRAEARATEQPGGIIHIQFVLAREGHAQLTGILKCEGTGLPPEGLMNGEYYSLASDYSDRLSEAGEMAMSMDLMPPVFGLSAPELLNFKLKCADLVTPWVPVKVKRLTE